jgi:hypothetical protein
MSLNGVRTSSSPNSLCFIANPREIRRPVSGRGSDVPRSGDEDVPAPMRLMRTARSFLL